MLSADQHVHGFRGLQRRVLIALKKSQPLTVKELAAGFKTTPNAVRRHLKALEAAAVVQYRSVVRGVGGPTFAYSLTDAGEGLFPRAYAGALAEALEIVREQQGIEGVVRVFHRQWESLADAARPRMTGRSLAERTAVLAELRTAQGYMAESESEPTGDTMIREHNCAIRDVAARFPEVCAAEERFFAELLGADVAREAHILEGCNAREYRVHPSVTPPGSGQRSSPAVEEQS
jgi:DeoR family transcriptional regulator, suf operon transcriptional repressor